VSGFDWDDANRNHIALHGVTVAEVEQAVATGLIELDYYNIYGENRSEDLGATRAGRILRLITTERRGLVRIVTAFDASPLEKRHYLQEMVKQR
jgi:uncharacterized DUF497 family protein